MPTVLLVYGWRFFFYANEGKEPMHIHCQKGEKECKYWLNSKDYEATEAYSYNMTPKDTRDIKKLIYEYFEYIETEWIKFEERK